MTDTVITIFIGVFSGILTSILIWVFIQLFTNVFIPWYQQSIYRGIDITGNWTSKHEYIGNVNVEQTIQLEQKGHKIKGSLISKNKFPSKIEDITSFKVVGEIFDNYVDLEYQIEDKKYIGRGSLLLKVKDGGQKLSGGLVAIDRSTTEVITTNNLEWTRKK